ncbi:MAG: hypothetical protein IT385_30655 [Deltaproteobacteria bacterium]|nr:hypothetical protein [Deltaproteobacteria bacterium]
MQPLARPVIVALALLMLGARAIAAEPAPAPDRPAPDRDPRNWPTITRLIADRYELAGRVFTLRVHAKRSDYFNCGYGGTEGRLMAFTLLGGPFETLTGYMPAELGKVLDRVLDNDPWAEVTVQVQFDPQRVSDLCIDQVDILKWSRGWQYPPETLAPERPDPGRIPTKERLAELAQPQLWKDLTSADAAPIGQQVQVAGGARLGTAFHCAFRGAWRTHWALELHDGRGRIIFGYLPKSERARELVDRITLHRDIALAVQARVVKVALSTYCPAQLEIVSWTAL